MNIPQIKSIDETLRIFYNHPEIGNKEILSLFGSISSATVVKLKKLVKDEMLNRNKLAYGMYKINTTIAYEVWGIDIADLEQRRQKLAELKL
jgi:hypothetical protein